MIRMATIDDIDSLVKLRIKLLEEAFVENIVDSSYLNFKYR
ncbi:hypothetical protein [Clostridium estertheticum]|nr:hypothetical protein [Clostridium estertheticum]